IRQFAGEMLRNAGEEVEVRRRHAVYFADLAETADAHLTSPERARWSDRLDDEFDNVRLAIGWSGREDCEGEVGLRLHGALRWVCAGRGNRSEGRAGGGARLAPPAGPPPGAARARALTSAGGAAFLQGDFPAAQRWLAESVELCRHLGNRRDLALALGLL